jgi:hypothetical protein
MTHFHTTFPPDPETMLCLNFFTNNNKNNNNNNNVLNFYCAFSINMFKGAFPDEHGYQKSKLISSPKG